MRDLILTGFMGTGKTTVGRLLAERYGLRFVDMDCEIERRAGRPIRDIFSASGEETFRRLESDLMRELAAGEGRVIATGGGALVSEHNRSLLRDDQLVVCLTCRPEELTQRLDGGTTRPLLTGKPADEVSRLLAVRRPAYERFEQIDTTGRAPREVADELECRFQLSAASTLTFESTRRSHLVFERGLIGRIGPHMPSDRVPADVILVSDQTLDGLGTTSRIVAALEARSHRVVRAVLPPGEEGKTLQTVGRLYELCQESNLDRQAIVLGVGGGVVGDIAGMLAATYLRGLRLVLAPTTLVAQADASIGGKVGVDFRGVKNLIGAFHPAELILIDPDALRTLPRAALSDGMAEIVKIALVRSKDLISLLEDLTSAEDILQQTHIIRRAALEKVEVVRRDPFERGERALLNFGHTIGHAIEAASGYQLSHGQAVSAGMVAETWLGERLGWASPEVLGRLTALLIRFGLPTQAPAMDLDLVLEFLHQDKKRRRGRVMLALPRGLGEGEVFEVRGESEIRSALEYVTGGSA